jgi:hypothetical protein
MADGRVLSAQQRIHSHTQLSRKILETASLQLVRDKHRALLGRQLIESRGESCGPPA